MSRIYIFAVKRKIERLQNQDDVQSGGVICKFCDVVLLLCIADLLMSPFFVVTVVQTIIIIMIIVITDL